MLRSFKVGDSVVYKPYENCRENDISKPGVVKEVLDDPGMYLVTFGQTSEYGTRTGKYYWTNLWKHE
jgi:hypothetical protein